MEADGQLPQPTAAPLPLSPQPAGLQARLAAAANRMPALRARLEAATDRLQRVVSAVSADINRAPPNTVEKALAGKTPGRPASRGSEGEENVPGVSPLVKQVGWLGTRPAARRHSCDAAAADPALLLHGHAPAAAVRAGTQPVPHPPPQALESGQISTRRRTARSPVPYSQPE